MSSVLITGATAGLGLQAARELAGAGHDLILAVRDRGRGERTGEQLRRVRPGGRYDVLTCDLSSLESVRAAAARIGTDLPVPDAVVANAGLQLVNGVQRSAEGLELTMATNVLGHVQLLELVRPRLPDGGRIVLVSSEVHRGGLLAWGFPRPRWDTPGRLYDPPAGSRGGGRAGRVRYANSKLAAIYLAHELSRREPRLRVYAFDPGLMPDTGLARDYPGVVRQLYRVAVPFIVMLPGARRVTDSGADLAWLAVSDEVNAPSGQYFSGREAKDSSRESYDGEREKALWEQSVGLLG